MSWLSGLFGRVFGRRGGGRERPGPLTGNPWQPPAPPPTPSGPTADFAATLLRLTNQGRAQKGAGSLSLNPLLTKAAQDHCDLEARHGGEEAHQLPGEPDPFARIASTGYRAEGAAENIAQCQSAEQCYSLWDQSPGHNQNQNNPSYTEVGFGMNGPYFCADYGRPAPRMALLPGEGSPPLSLFEVVLSGPLPRSAREDLFRLLKERHAQGRPVQRDVATHALLLVGNGWPAQEALAESQRTLDDAEMESGGY